MYVPVAIALLFFLCAGTEGLDVSQDQFNEIDDRLLDCLSKLPPPVEPWDYCRFFGTDSLGNVNFKKKEDLTKVVVDCLVEKKKYKKDDISKAESCLKESLAKPLKNKK